MKQKTLKNKIKEMETAKRLEAVVHMPPDNMVSFDQWWVALSKRMSLRPSLKEIMWADFRARGLNKEESNAKYDEALKLFGL